MFTGIIQSVGQIQSVTPINNDTKLRINASGLGLDDVNIGDSIAVNGVCLTAINITSTHFEAQVSNETLKVTVSLNKLGAVNLEKALRLHDRLGGHLVSGHVDGVGEIIKFEISQPDELINPTELIKPTELINSTELIKPTELINQSELSQSNPDKCWLLVIRAPHAISKYIAKKGSICVNGVSLTVNSIANDVFSMNIIPHTMQQTMFADLQTGSLVNLEIDQIARYVERMTQWANEVV